MPPTYLSRVKPTATYLASWMFKCLSSAQHSIFYPQNLPKSALFIVLIWLIIFKASTLPILYLMETTLLFLRFRVCCHYLHVAYTVSYARILSHRNPFPLLVQSYLHDFIYTVFFIQYIPYSMLLIKILFILESPGFVFAGCLLWIFWLTLALFLWTSFRRQYCVVA